MVSPQAWQRDISRSAYRDHLVAQQVARRDIAAVLREAAREAEQMAARLLPDQGVGAQVRRAQAQVLTQELTRQQVEVWGNVTRTTQANLERGAVAAAEGNQRLAEYLVRAGADPALGSQFTLAARYSGESVVAKYMNNIDLSPTVYRNQQRVIGQANRVVARGLAQNKSAREIAKSVRGFISPDTPGGVNYAAMRLARTEINNAFHATNVQMYDSSPFVEAVQWEISGSHPRPDECDDLADRDEERLGPGVYRPENVPMKPHPQCLCNTTAIAPSPEQFVNDLANGKYDPWLRSEGFPGIQDEWMTG